MPKKLPAFGQDPTILEEILPKEPSLAERTAEALLEVAALDSGDFDKDHMIEILNRAFLEAQADYIAEDVAEMTSDGQSWWTAQISGETRVFSGPLPAEGTLVKTYSPLAGKIYIRSVR